MPDLAAQRSSATCTRVHSEGLLAAGAVTLLTASILLALALAAGLSPVGALMAVVTQTGLLCAALGRLLVPSFHPHARFGRASWLTLLRSSFVAILGAFAFDAALSEAWSFSLALFGCVALILDGFDGALARRDGTSSAFGAWLDQEVDAALILCLAVLCWRTGAVGPWILVAGGLRYGFLALRHFEPRFRGELPFSQRRRVCCVIQIAALLICLVPFLPTGLRAGFALAAVGGLVLSFAIDLVRLWLQPLPDSTSAPALL